MTDGHLTEERRLMQQAAREFTDAEVLPLANALDPDKGEIPRDLIEKMGEMGYFGITIPEAVSYTHLTLPTNREV